MSPDLLSHKSNRHLIVGASGTGKTTCLIHDIWGQKHDYVFVFDHQEELAEKLGVIEATDFGEFQTRLEESNILCFNPRVLFPNELPACFDAFCGWVYDVAEVLPGRKVFVCDEIQFLTGTGDLSSSFQSILETSRRRRLDSILGAQSSNRVHNIIRNQTTDAFFYTSPSPNAMDWPISLGIPETELKTLPEFHFVYCHVRSNTWKKSKIII